LVGSGGVKIDTTTTTTSGTTSTITFNTPAHATGTVTVRVYGTPSGTDANEVYATTTITYTGPPSYTVDDPYLLSNVTSTRTITGTGIGVNSSCPIQYKIAANPTSTFSCIPVISTTSNSVVVEIPARNAGQLTTTANLRVFGVNGTSSNGIYTDSLIYHSSQPTDIVIDNPYVSANTSGTQRLIQGWNVSSSTYPAKVLGGASTTFVSATSSFGFFSVTTEMPNLDPGLYDLRVYGQGGNDSNGIYTDLSGFIVYAPYVESVSPTTLSAVGGETVTITGRGLKVGDSGVRIFTPGGTNYLRDTAGDANISVTYTTPPSSSGGTSTLRIFGEGGNDSNEIYVETSTLYVAPVYNQSSFRWFQNANSATPGTPLADINTSTTFTNAGEQVRLRMTIDLSVIQSPAGDSFLLQVASSTGACSSGLNYTSVLGGGNGNDILFYNNSNVLDGSSFVATSTDPTHSGHTNVAQTYEEEVGFSSINTINVGNDGIWDFSLQNNSAKRGLTYCFRIVKNDGSFTPLNNYGVYPSISVVNIAPEVQNVTASQNASGTVNISYETRDPDSDSGAANPGFVTPSFDYWNGSSWVNIASSSLEAFDLVAKSITSSSFTQHTATWTPVNQIPGVYNTGAQIRVTVNDGEATKNTATSTSNTYTLDTTDPVVTTATFDSRNDLLHLNSSDNQTLTYLLSNNSNFSADGLNASSGIHISAGGTSVSSTLSWNASGTPSYERIYVWFQDAVNNIASTTIITPTLPSSFVLADDSNPGAGFYAETLSWSPHTNITSSTAQYYEVWRSINNTSSFTLHATTTNAFFNDTGLSGSNTYFYKLAVRSTQGNYSEYSATLGDRPDGSGTSSDTSFAPDFDTTFDSVNQTGVSIYQSTSSNNSNWGQVLISYKVRDRDNTSGTINPSYEYNLGSGWIAISSSTMNATSTDAKTVSSSSFTTHTVSWNAKQQIPGTYSTNLRVRVTANDGLMAGSSESAPKTLDTVAPTITSTTLKINGFTANAEATSSAAYLVQIQNVSHQPTDETIYPAITTDLSNFYQLLGNGTVATNTNTYYTSLSSSSLTGTSWTWTNGGSLLYLYLTDNVNNVATDTISVIGVNDAPEIQSISTYQATSSTPTAGGQVIISYSARDTDNTTNTPTFAYNLGAGWITIPSSTLNSTATNPLSVSSSYQSFTASWSATSTVSSTYNTAVQIRLTLSDNQGVNSSTIATSSFILDTIGPSLSSSSLLINGSPASSESTSTLISLSLQNVSSTPNPETIFVQFSDDDGNTWYGANSNGTLTTSTWGSGISSNTTTTWSLNISGRARTISTRATDAYGNTISTDTNTVGYNQSPEFNSSYGTGGLVVLQDATSTNPTWGQVLISYGVRDTDTSVGSSTPNEITPSFSFNYGSGWTDITSGFLGANDLEDKGVDQSIFTTHTATWNATSQAPGVYSNNLQLRVRVSDNETVASTSESILSNITLDTKVPVANSFRLDSRTNHIIHSFADDSLLSYRFSNNSNLSADGFNTSSSLWNDTLATTSVASTSWIPNVSSSLEKIYYEVRDRYGNIASGSAAAPLAPSSTTIQDVSNTNTASFAELISWSVYNSTSAAPFAAYEVYVSTSSASDGFSLLASITDNSQNFYRHNNLASSTTYYYKVSTKTSNNDYSDYSSVVSDQPDGLSGAAAEGPIISNIQAAEVHASWARITWDTDRLSNSKVEYGTSTNYSSQTSTVSLVIGHEIFIDGLTQNSDYNFRVTSVDINNKQTVSDNYTFTTTGGPIISAVSTQSVTDNTATITWNTNKDANSTVIYSTLLQNLRNNSGTLNAGNSSLVGGPPYQHRVTLPALTQQTSYYYYVQSTDNTNNTTADKKNGDYYTFTTTQDTKAPIISNVQVAATTQNAAVITWNTDELTTSQVFYDTRNVSSSQFASFTTRDEILTTNHAVTLTALQPLTTYFYDVRSVDAAGNPSKSEEKSFATSDSVQTIILASGGGAPPSPAVDTTPPTISDIEIVKIEPFGAEISFKTNEPTVGFISFGETNAYGRVTANPEFKSKHTLALRGLKLGTTYHFQIKAQDKSGNFATADDQKLTTLYAVEDFNNLISLDSVEQFENQIENLIESITPSLITPFIGKIEITDITENSATVKWETNTNTFGSVAYVAENDFDSEKENPYATEISDSQPKTTKHQVTLNNLAPGTLYHFQIKSFTLPEVVGKSADRTFITRSLKIRPQVSNLQNTSFAISWQTSKFTSSFVEFTNTKTNQVDRTGTDEKSTTHVVNVQNLTPNTAYRVKAFGYDENQNIVESETITVTTSRDVIAPEISALKIDNTFVPGRNDRIQTVVSWKTDEPAISQVFYEEGSGRNTTLANVASSTSAYNLNHNVIITNFRPGTIYRIQVVSTDAAGNVTRSPIRAIITPQQTRSVFDVILKNFEDSFRFLQ
ncbi:MAG: fibronectin type III domain-containing protein, partial [Anaplasmataceae bacterium]|nr:fibronectin type III domain-containing protein [Anaplasmataceae bacterium]